MGFVENNNNGVVYMTSSNISTAHAFTTRFGGVSGGVFESMNLAVKSGDDIENVKENYRRICSILGITTDDIACSNQVHGTNVRVVTRDDCNVLFTPTENFADGQISNTPGIALMVFIADCVPILLHDQNKNVIGAIHAGWRSTVSNIAGIAVQKMESEFGCLPSDIKAALGPSISKCCYETNADVANALLEILPDAMEHCLTQHGDKYMTDLKAANYALLTKAGLSDISISDECTSCLSDKYWSHRKTGGKRGSQVAIITLSQ